ncbi:metal-binding-domain/4Fe-4S-binding-domain containing ABC transporter, ATP-binding protein [Caldisphaera lagunensis DSM 15908]|uniref:Metal-binding-domain/4Fe-4S-binding-domain containing ABC transporter, ATP-binding protein n=1 Tax=Caldisphaera lagunensis (strain DSM 15908 / JCM 11604 / ANMR 0165 / IC-154) TaxID=1056495 RepID=L0ACG9_CALLD|nr:diphthine--ammonia ligase [Caldisphaera lagunensis]AFZ71104.1 metal-binding-domain/4Fe-4S-binding-domain containing ABC transporter, ATP-binding protein [Caldisphaera lagunensis DSM 15908]
MPKKACSLLSGGKDSTYALHKAVDFGYEISCIASIKPKRNDSYMFHFPFVELTNLQTESMGLKEIHYLLNISGEKEKEVEELYNELYKIKKINDFDTLVIGGIASQYQLKRFEYLARKLNVNLFDPQWGKDPIKYMYELIDYNISFIITQITTYGIPIDFLGIKVDKNVLKKLVDLSKLYGFHIAFEGGEAETFVINAPLFKKGICLEAYRKKISEFEYSLVPKKAFLCDNAEIILNNY